MQNVLCAMQARSAGRSNVAALAPRPAIRSRRASKAPNFITARPPTERQLQQFEAASALLTAGPALNDAAQNIFELAMATEARPRKLLLGVASLLDRMNLAVGEIIGTLGSEDRTWKRALADRPRA